MRSLSNQSIVLASHNPGKLKEISALLAPYGVTVKSAAAFDLKAPEETETTFEGNARIKAHFSAKETGLPALSDDSGLEIDALDGAPGVYSADWAETPQGRDFDMAMKTVWDKLQASEKQAPYTARFVCVLCIAWPDGTDAVFRGTVDGTINWPAIGQNGFGYDPIFTPTGKIQSFGELDPAIKHAMSHRADAFAKLKSACFND